MGDILGLGVTHYPPLLVPDARMARILERTLQSDRVPTHTLDYVETHIFNSNKCFAIF